MEEPQSFFAALFLASVLLLVAVALAYWMGRLESEEKRRALWNWKSTRYFIGMPVLTAALSLSALILITSFGS